MIAENYKIVPLIQYADMSADVVCDSFNMKGYHTATFVFMFGTLSGANATLTICSGTTAAAVTSPLYFNYAYGGAVVGTAVAGSTASSDVLGAWTNVATLAIANGTYDNFMLVCEVDASVMDLANSEEWMTAKFTTAGSVVGRVDGIAILKPRYPANRIPTCLA